MTKLPLFAITATVLVPAALFGQTAALQQQGWLRFPGTNLTTVHPETLVGQSGPVTGKPLSADEVRRSVQTLADGSHIENTETDHFYRDSMGRMRTETATGAVIYDPVAGYTYDLWPQQKAYTRSPISADATVTIAAQAHQSSVSSHSGSGAAGHDAAHSNSTHAPLTEDLPAQTLNGLYLKGSRVTMTIPAGAVGNDRELKSVNERWFSDDLKLLVKSSNSDPRYGTNTYELKNIVQSEPSSTLFQPPADYTLSVGHPH